MTGVGVLENCLYKIEKVGSYCKIIDIKFYTDWCECELGDM